MKLGRKKAPEASVDEQPADNAEPKTKTKTRAPAGSKLKHLGSTALSQALVVLLAGVAAIALMHFLVLQPATEERFKAWKTAEADAASQA